MKAKRLPQEGIVLEVIENLHEVIWAKIASGVKKFIKGFMEDLLREEVTDRIGAERYERSNQRQRYRNGHYVRDLLTRFGLVEDIRVPRVTPGGTEFTVWHRYEQRRRDVDARPGPTLPEWGQHPEVENYRPGALRQGGERPDREQQPGLMLNKNWRGKTLKPISTF
jgi:hypothetical protein